MHSGTGHATITIGAGRFKEYRLVCTTPRSVSLIGCQLPAELGSCVHQTVEGGRPAQTMEVQTKAAEEDEVFIYDARHAAERGGAANAG